MSSSLFFVVIGTPKSLQSKRRDRWQERVRGAASRAMGAGSPANAVFRRARIVYFFPGATQLDVDNFAKPILDALSGVLIEDDGLIEELVIRKTPLDEDTSFVDPPAAVAAAIDERTDFVLVSLDDYVDHGALPL